MPVAKKGKFSEIIFSIIRANVRNRGEVDGDLYSVASCNEVGGRRLVAMMDEFGMSNLDHLSDHIIETSKSGML